MVYPPVCDIDPFCRDFFENPFPAYGALRDAGPVVRQPRYDVCAVARYTEVHDVINDWQTSAQAAAPG